MTYVIANKAIVPIGDYGFHILNH